MNESLSEIEDTPAYAAHWIIGYVLLAMVAFHFASLPRPADLSVPRNPSSWANR
jgi:hypothetical protein